MRETKVVPWQGTRKWRPPIFLVEFIRATMFLTIELWIYEGTRRRVVERVWSIVDPFSFEQVACSCELSGCTRVLCFCLEAEQKQS